MADERRGIRGSVDGHERGALAKDGEGSSSLRIFLVNRYSDLKHRLARRLGSSDWAEDALQDTYLRLDGVEAVGEIRNPAAYLLRAAFNIALNQRRADSRRLSAADIAALVHVADDAPDALRVIESKSDMMNLKRVMAELPPRTREILLASRLDGMSRREIAERFSVSVSTVEKELRRAQEFCVTRVDRLSKSRGKAMRSMTVPTTDDEPGR
jgi:RNA polymerase sigma-70 factor (ECF subfamily)